MNVEEIVSLLKNERGRLDTAITALESVSSDGSHIKPHSNKEWTPARRRKYKATIAAKKRGHK